jgi:plasmid stabilization system protein ParE
VPRGRDLTGPLSPRTHLAPGLRMAVHRRYPVLYRDLPGEDTVRIERVLHSARNLPRLL